MTKKKRPNFSPEFRLETAQLVVDNGYTNEDAEHTMPEHTMQHTMPPMISPNNNLRLILAL
jgi:hypothetical protein